jgi:hypothetical protein
MGRTDNNDNSPPNARVPCSGISLVRVVVGLVAVMLPLSSAFAASWKIKPSVSASETYTDNVNLAPAGQEKSDLITSIAPGVSVEGKGRRLKLRADYRAQAVIYARENSRNRIYNRFHGDANAELMRDYLFMDADGAATQQLLTPSQGVLGNNIGGGSTTNVYTYSLSPYLRHRFGGTVDALVRYTNYGTRYSSGSVSDANGNRVNARFSSGPDFGRLGCGLNYSNDRLSRQAGGDVKNESATANASYLLTHSLSLLAQTGYEHHDFRTTTPTRAFQNGSYWAAGVGWQPNPKLQMQALYGSRYKSVTGRWRPTTRTALDLGWVDRTVGLNPGRSWNGTFSLKSRHTRWSASYAVDTITSQQYVFSGITYFDPTTLQFVNNPVDPTNLLVVYLFTPTNEVYTRRRGQITVGFHTGRTSAGLSVFNERRTYLLSNTDARAYGGSGSLRWRFGARTSLLLGGSAQRTRYLATGQMDKLWYLSTGLSRRVTTRTTTALTYRHTSLDSTVSNRNYRENRIEASINVRF